MMEFKILVSNLELDWVFTTFKWLKNLPKVALENGVHKQDSRISMMSFQCS